MYENVVAYKTRKYIYAIIFNFYENDYSEDISVFDLIIVESLKNIVEFFASNELLPEDAVYSKEKNLTFIDFEEYEDIRELHKSKAIQENQNIHDLDEPLEIDDHQIHQYEHTRFLICDDSKDISSEDREKLLQHISKHKTMSLN